MHEELHIREMTINDYDHVVTVWKAAGIQLTTSDEKPEIQRMIQHNPGLCLVLEINENNNGNKSMQTNPMKIIGAVLGGFDGRRGWVHHLAVHPNYQGKGYGKKLMDELTERFKQRNVVKLKLEVVEENKAVTKFYEKLGWDLRPEIITMSKTLRD